MNKNRKSLPPKNGIVILAIIVLAALAILLCWMFINTLHTDDDRTGPQAQTTAPTEMLEVTEETDPSPTKETYDEPTWNTKKEIPYPYLLDDGKLQIESVFQYTGLNPDSGWSDGTDIGAIALKNTSDAYLECAEIRLLLSDGSELQFMIYDIPPEAEVWAFELDNKVCKPNAYVIEVQTETRYADESRVLTSEQVQISYSGTQVTLKNELEEDLRDFEVRCHNIYNGIYFGGISYVYNIEFLHMGETTEIYALDCFLGETEASCIFREMSR